MGSLLALAVDAIAAAPSVFPEGSGCRHGCKRKHGHAGPEALNLVVQHGRASTQPCVAGGSVLMCTPSDRAGCSCYLRSPARRRMTTAHDALATGCLSHLVSHLGYLVMLAHDLSNDEKPAEAGLP